MYMNIYIIYMYIYVYMYIYIYIYIIVHLTLLVPSRVMSHNSKDSARAVVPTNTSSESFQRMAHQNCSNTYFIRMVATNTSSEWFQRILHHNCCND